MTGRRNSVFSISTLSQASVAQSWANCIRGDPVTKRGKRIQKFKVLFLTMIPTLFLVGQNIVALIKDSKHLETAETLRRDVLFSTEAGRIMHFLQEERGKTVLYVSSADEGFKSDLQLAYNATDAAIKTLTRWPEPAKDSIPIMEDKEVFHYHIKKHREQLLRSRTTVELEIKFYSEMIEQMIGWVSSNIREVAIGSVWKSVVAYHMLVMSKEQAGVERALGGVFYVKGSSSFTFLDYQWFLQKYHYGKTYMDRCMQYSTSICQRNYNLMFKETTLERTIGAMEAEILRNSGTGASTVRADYWFQNMTLYMGKLKEIEQILSDFVDTTILADEGESTNALTASIIILIIVLILSPFTVIFVFSIISDIHKAATVLKTKSNELEVEKMQTTRLLYQMLPRQIADTLRRRETVAPESYECVTIFFSDIVGFSEFAAECAPLAIVDILNYLYKVFDTRIEVYDAFKIQTIGDAYMVVSGCPERNGDLHAKEIGLMALDLLQSIQMAEMPLIGGETMKLRIGIHSGPCVTGVVGYTMPRYCLFGDTVYTASRIEAGGLPNKIHVSQLAYQIMKEQNIFDLEERGLIKIRGKGLVLTYWLNGMLEESGSRTRQYSKLSFNMFDQIGGGTQPTSESPLPLPYATFGNN